MSFENKMPADYYQLQMIKEFNDANSEKWIMNHLFM